MEKTVSDVVVVGGGVIGLCSALDLARQGADVVLLERSTCGAGASLRNGGWVTTSLSTPLPEPRAAMHALLAMAQPRSPFMLRPRFDPALATWIWRFWRSSSSRRWRLGLEQLAALNARTFQLFDDLRDHGVEFEMHSTGLILVARTAKGLDHLRALFAALTEVGYRGKVREYDSAELRAQEPALATDVHGGIHALEARHVRPESLVAGLSVAAKKAGVELVEQSEVTRVARTNGRWTVSTPDGEHASRRVLVAAGSHSRDLLKPLRINLRLEGAKGYSITAKGTGNAPRHSLYLTEAKVGFTPFSEESRLAGTLELGSLDSELRRRRLDAIVASAKLYLRDWSPCAPAIEWAGVRPLAPDGLPIIGALPGQDGLFVATGHGMFGVTLAPGTASALTPLVLEDKLVPELEPFRPGRFGGRR